MRKAALLYNPGSGGSRRRQQELESALQILIGAGVEASLVPTQSAAHAEQETRQAISSNHDTIFACGGDGTIHNIAQVLANTPVALGVLPIGTANALAHDLRLPLNVVEAAEAALRAVPRRVALGHVSYVDLKGDRRSRFFVIAAGMGVDAHLFYKLHSGMKQRMGMSAYYSKAWHLWCTYAMPLFRAEYEDALGRGIRADVTELMAIRIRYFGGILKELAPGASLERDDLRLVLCRTASRWAYLTYVIRGMLGQTWSIRGIELAHSAKVVCDYLPPSPGDPKKQRQVYIEADGEVLGTLPAEITVVPDALTILAPAR
jgi:diacylglycerol kinase family enzyme